ncbi:Helix-turn-helix domain protein [Rosistilla oblonga]|nr:Helix-turn-helix domain protein [Rosistilla oblonga]
MTFGEKIRSLRQDNEFTLRELAEQVRVGFTYLSKIENSKLNFGDAPSRKLIHKLADALHADEHELLLLAGKVPETIRQRVIERPDAFRVIAGMNDRELDAILDSAAGKKRAKKAAS